MKRLLAVFTLSLALLGFSQAALTQEESTCPVLIETALAITNRACEGMSRNQACYGHTQVEAQPQPQFDAFDFDEIGELADLTALRSMRVSALDVASGLWGVAMMKVSARQPGGIIPEPVTFVLFGDSRVENRVPIDAVQATIVSGQTWNLRLMPNLQGHVLGTLRGGESVTVRGKLRDGSWLYVESEAGLQGWVTSSAVPRDADLDSLSVLQPDNAHFGAMQAFTLQTGEDRAACGSMPENGLLVQTPDGVAEITLWINEVKVSLGSTAFIRAQAGDRMTISMLEGHARVEAFGVTSIAVAGAEVVVPLDETGMASAPPQRPTAIDTSALDGLPVTLLDRELPPLSEIPVYIPPAQDNNAPGQGGSASGQNDCPGNSCNAPGLGGNNPPGQDGCPGNSCNAPGQGNTPPGQDGCPGNSCNAPGQGGGIPPGQGGTPPGQGGNNPPGQGGGSPPDQGASSPPGQGGVNPPGPDNCPGNSCYAPGHGNTPPGQGGIPPGQRGNGNN